MRGSDFTAKVIISSILTVADYTNRPESVREFHVQLTNKNDKDNWCKLHASEIFATFERYCKYVDRFLSDQRD